MMRSGKYIAEPAESEAVRQIFEMYLNGMSLKSIAAEMNVPYNADKLLWNKNMVSRILENKRYTGDETYPQIIEQDTFDRANSIKAEKGKTALPVDNTTKYVRGLVKYTKQHGMQTVERIRYQVADRNGIKYVDRRPDACGTDR